MRFYGLSLLTANEVEVAFVIEDVSDMPDDERFRKFADYVVENYLDGGCDFPPMLWAESPNLNLVVASESYHTHLSAEFYSAQPNIYLFVNTLLRQQTSTYISLACVPYHDRGAVSVVNSYTTLSSAFNLCVTHGLLYVLMNQHTLTQSSST